MKKWLVSVGTVSVASVVLVHGAALAQQEVQVAQASVAQADSQTTAAEPPSAATQPAPAAGQPAVQAQNPPRDPEAQRRRNQIRLIEGVLVQAVRLGAERVSHELERFEPAGVTMLVGTPRARGFVIDSHGVFFDVEVPDMNQSVVWSVMQAQRDRQVGNALDSLRTALRAMPEGTSAHQAQLALQVVERTVGPMQPAPQPGQVGAAAAVELPDPRGLYQDAVIDNVVDAMLGYSLQLNLGPEEWLTVAARGNDAPVSPLGLSDSVTITVKVKGADLAAYHADVTRRAEIRARVKADARVF